MENTKKHKKLICRENLQPFVLRLCLTNRGKKKKKKRHFQAFSPRRFHDLEVCVVGIQWNSVFPSPELIIYMRNAITRIKRSILPTRKLDDFENSTNHGWKKCLSLPPDAADSSLVDRFFLQQGSSKLGAIITRSAEKTCSCNRYSVPGEACPRRLCPFPANYPCSTSRQRSNRTP